MERELREYKDNIQKEATRRVELKLESSWSWFFRNLASQRVRWIVLLIGALSTMLPWYLSNSISGDFLYLSLYSGLFAANLGMEFAALLFYVGLLMTSYRSNGWSVAGGIFMVIGAMIGSYSVQGFPGVGVGMLLGLLVILYAFLPAISFLITMEDLPPIDQ
jgi:hypothetical protein